MKCFPHSTQYQQVEYDQTIHQNEWDPCRSPNAANAIDHPRLEAVRIALYPEANVALSRAGPPYTCEEAVFAQYADCVQEEDAN